MGEQKFDVVNLSVPPLLGHKKQVRLARLLAWLATKCTVVGGREARVDIDGRVQRVVKFQPGFGTDDNLQQSLGCIHQRSIPRHFLFL